MNTRNLKDLVGSVADETDYVQSDVDVIVRATLEEIVDTLVEGDKINLPGFGAFYPTDTKARTGRNPKTGEPVPIAASVKVSFKAAKAFKDRVKA